ncbi:MAG: PEGA domain-containing protein [Polyangiaceae bacterium]
MVNRSKWIRLWSASAVVAGALMCTSAAYADAADDAFARGQKLAENGQLPEAETAFEEAWSQRKAWDIAGNLGLTELALGKNAEAATHLDYALKHLGGLATPDQKGGLQSKFDEVRAKVAEIQLEAEPGANIKVGTVDLGTMPLETAIFVDPGTVTLSATKAGFEDASTQVEATAGGTFPVKLAQTAKGGGESDRPIWPAIILGVVAAGGIGAGIGLSVAAAGIDSDLEGVTCPGGAETCPPSALDDVDRRNSFVDGAIATLAIGVAALGATIGLAVWASSGSSPANTVRLEILPRLGPGTSGAWLRATF